METEVRMMIARGWREETIGNYCLMDTEFQLEKTKKFWKWVVVMVVHQCECTKCH